MDEPTLRYYDTRAADIGAAFASIESPLRRYFAAAFPEGGRVLDVGAGTGREVAALVSEGYTAYGIEPIASFRDLALVHYPDIGDRIRAGTLPDDLPTLDELGGPFQGVVCSAVLQHIPRSRLFDAVYALRGLLAARGRLLVSIPAARPGIENERDAAGRLFTGISADELELLFERLGFVSIGRWDGNDALGRSDHTWVTLCLELRSSGESRPLDHLESVLSTRERKVATYKLALLRALCSIALTAPHSVTFSRDGQVRVPLRAVAERWIDYYWPLFESETFLPQMQGEETDRGHRLAFTRELHDLQHLYHRSAGGFGAFDLDRRSRALRGAAAGLHKSLVRKLGRTIVAGPVTYAGGSLTERMFSHERGHVLVAAPLWRELSLTGHWIQEALLLRWAELVSRLSRKRVQPGDVLNALMLDLSPDRDTRAARVAYQQHKPLECVWTGGTIRQPSLAIDHVLPYSLWRNNDLWNLVPTRASVNLKKSDRLPTRRLLRARRDAIVSCWEATLAAYPKRFRSEARAQTGAHELDLVHLFDRLVESVEITALQRACVRWEP